MNRPMNRQEHLAWCKKRALEYVDRGDLESALQSMVSDLRKHDETARHIGIDLGTIMLMSGQLQNAHQMRKFIDGFN